MGVRQRGEARLNKTREAPHTSLPAMPRRSRLGVRLIGGDFTLELFHDGDAFSFSGSSSRSFAAKSLCACDCPTKVPRVPSVTSHADAGDVENLLKGRSGSIFHEPGSGLPFIETGIFVWEGREGEGEDGEGWWALRYPFFPRAYEQK